MPPPPPDQYYFDSSPQFPNPPQLDAYLPPPAPPLPNTLEQDYSLLHDSFPQTQEVHVDCNQPSIHGLPINGADDEFPFPSVERSRFPPENFPSVESTKFLPENYPSVDSTRFPPENFPPVESTRFPPEFLPSIAHSLPPSLMLELPSAESSRRTRCSLNTVQPPLYCVPIQLLEYQM